MNEANKFRKGASVTLWSSSNSSYPAVDCHPAGGCAGVRISAGAFMAQVNFPSLLPSPKARERELANIDEHRWAVG